MLDVKRLSILREVAQQASFSAAADTLYLSQSAVSRVFTPGASVSPKTAEKVRAAADALGYRPNVLAGSPRKLSVRQLHNTWMG